MITFFLYLSKYDNTKIYKYIITYIQQPGALVHVIWAPFRYSMVCHLHPASLRNIHHGLQGIWREGFFKVRGHQQVLCNEPFFFVKNRAGKQKTGYVLKISGDGWLVGFKCRKVRVKTSALNWIQFDNLLKVFIGIVELSQVANLSEGSKLVARFSQHRKKQKWTHTQESFFLIQKWYRN